MLALFHGVPWVHTAPALLAVVFGFLYLKSKRAYLKVFWGLLWLLFIPNTAYIFVDVERLALHWDAVSMVMRFALAIQYICLEILGLVTFLLAMLPFESVIDAKHFSQRKQVVAIILFNFIIGFGMVLGRTGYTNSYVVFTQPIKVFYAVVHIITSPNLLALTLGFGVLCSCLYLLLRNTLLPQAQFMLKK